MKRNSLILTILCIIGILLWFFWPKAREQSPILFPQESEVPTPQTPSPPATAAPAYGNGSMSNLNTNVAQRPTQDSSKFQRSGLETWRLKVSRPIAFYGKVVDEDNEPVEGASVSFICNQFAVPETSIKTNATTDQNGLFSISGIFGSTLGVQVSKPGYYPVRGLNQDSFDFLEHSDTAPFQPDRGNPVVYHLRRKGPGANLITSQRGMAPDLEISGLQNGSIVRVDFFNQKVGSEGQMEISAVKPPRGQGATDWSVRMSIPDGGFIEEADEFPFQAPESGYTPTIEFHFEAGTTNWTENFHKQFYIVFGQPPKYGHLDLDTGINRGISLRYGINPDGSRNLEPKDITPQQRNLPPGVTEIVPKQAD